MTAPASPSSASPKDFESAMSELESIVRDLETGKTSLEQSVAAYERGMTLKSFCEAKLQDARLKVEKITVGQTGAVSTEPFDTKE